MICKHCGAEIEDDALFCEECGSKVEKIKTEPGHLPTPEPVKEEKKDNGNDRGLNGNVKGGNQRGYVPDVQRSAGKEKKTLPVLIAVILAVTVVLAVAVCLVVSIVVGNKNKNSGAAAPQTTETETAAVAVQNVETTALETESSSVTADLNAIEVSQFELSGYCMQNYNGELHMITDDVSSVYAADSFGNAHYYDSVSEFVLSSDSSEILKDLDGHQVSVIGSLYAIDAENVGLAADFVEILDKSSRIEMDYCDNSSITYPHSAADFTEVTCPDGSYTLMYPKSVFAEGYYDEDTESYYFSSADKSLILTVGKQAAPVKNDPVSCANYMMNSVVSLFVAGDETPYIHESSGVSESGFSRAIIGGQIKSDLEKGKYILYACNSESAYTFEFTFPYGGTSGITIDYTECGYMLDCMYRGWSISGSTRELRTYNQYMTDDMGAKKED